MTFICYNLIFSNSSLYNPLLGDKCDIDINECKISHDICNGQGRCINTLGSFRCFCDLGYKGKHCQENIDDCEISLFYY